jgi:hypothetical protein
MKVEASTWPGWGEAPVCAVCPSRGYEGGWSVSQQAVYEAKELDREDSEVRRASCATASERSQTHPQSSPVTSG